MEAGHSSFCVFLDLAKAFDSVPHHNIIMALSSLGVVNQPLAWFKDYLSDRSQFVVVQGSSSPLSSVTSGVPQGSILGPLLFIVAFDGIFHLPLSNNSSLIGYADDLTYSRILSCDEDLTAID